LDVSKLRESPTFHAPGQRQRIASVLAEDDDVAIGRARYGKGMKAPFHSHVGEEYIHVIRGKGVFRTRTKEITATSGTVIRFAPGEEHQLENRWKEPLEFVFVYPESKDTTPLKEKWVRIR
jgi:quercetin dioxygenase-like cupin family protein